MKSLKCTLSLLVSDPGLGLGSLHGDQLTLSVVAVIAFKAVVTLDLTRRDNDRKVVALKLQMQDMMSVLLEFVSHT